MAAVERKELNEETFDEFLGDFEKVVIQAEEMQKQAFVIRDKWGDPSPNAAMTVGGISREKQLKLLGLATRMFIAERAVEIASKS